MSNNMLVGYNFGIVKENIEFEDTPITSTNTNRVTSANNVGAIVSYVPNSTINSLTALAKNQGCMINMKLASDFESFFSKILPDSVPGEPAAHLFEAQFAGTSGTSLSAYTPEIGTAHIRTGTIVLNGTGGAVFGTAGYAVYTIDTVLPSNKKVTVYVISIDGADTSFGQVTLRQNSDQSQYLAVALLKLNSTTLRLSIRNQSNPTLATVDVTTTAPATLEVTLEGNVITAMLNGSNTITYTDTSGLPNVTEVLSQAGMTLNSILVDNITA